MLSGFKKQKKRLVWLEHKEGGVWAEKAEGCRGLITWHPVIWSEASAVGLAQNRGPVLAIIIVMRKSLVVPSVREVERGLRKCQALKSFPSS